MGGCKEDSCDATAMSAARIALGVASKFVIQPEHSDHIPLLKFIVAVAGQSVELMPVCRVMEGWRDSFFEIDFGIGEWIARHYKDHGVLPKATEARRKLAEIVGDQYIPY